MVYKPIQLDKMRNFKYGMRAISYIEDALGKPVSKLDMDNLTMKEAATFVWAGLVHEDKQLTVDDVMDLIDEYSSPNEIMNIAGEALQMAFGGNGEKNSKKVVGK